MITLVKKATSFLKNKAIISDGKSYTYSELLKNSESIALSLLNEKNDLEGARIAFLVPSSYQYTSIQWGIWRAGGIAVPLCEKHPIESIEYVLKDTTAKLVFYSMEYKALLKPLLEQSPKRFVLIEELETRTGQLPDIKKERDALILFTSGTSGSPKGVVTTHSNIEAQIIALSQAWEWSSKDHILNVLPMHHVHGIINIMSCALWNGACCEFLVRFDAKKVFEVFAKQQVNLFMAVPTIYFKLISYWKEIDQIEQKIISENLKAFRLMVSGSAALPVSVLEEWEIISSHTLLERYGMTEMGMAISNPYRGERKPGYIGQPLPGVSIRLADENNQIVNQGTQGEIHIKGENVFKEYWNNPQETANSFTQDSWFRSGDIAVYQEGAYKILGRNSVDIIKSGGYKISALEIEEVLRSHPKIKDCAVVGILDLEWGEIIAAGIVLSNKSIDLNALKTWLKAKLPGYKTPRKYIELEQLPRNVMGKVTKKELVTLFNS